MDDASEVEQFDSLYRFIRHQFARRNSRHSQSIR
jgi:hypothetical protein